MLTFEHLLIRYVIGVRFTTSHMHMLILIVVKCMNRDRFYLI